MLIMIKGIIDYSHHLLEQTIKLGEVVVDATCGNGHDTLLLSKIVGKHGQVFAFDIQEAAIQNSQKLMAENKRTNVTFIHDSHAKVKKYLQENEVQTIGGAIFNLGYLPRSDKKIITKGKTTIEAISSLLPFLKKEGLIVVVIYHGHEGGPEEKEMVLEYTKRLNQEKYRVLRYGFINQKNNPPFIVAIQKI